MSTLRPRAAALLAHVGYHGHQPVVVGLQRGRAPTTVLAQGSTSGGEPLTASTPIYTASLSKQMTAACAAVLAQRGELEMESALSHWMPELPAWAQAVRLRHLVHHTAALPDDSRIDAVITTGPDRTTAAVVHALAQFPVLDRQPGDEYVYSNAGYVCLARAVERATGQTLSQFARRHLFTPLGMANTCYWSGPQPAPAGAAPLANPHPAPLSLGDGGVWATATDLLRWNQALNDDVLGISTLLQTPGRRNDGTPLDYAWGVGVRLHAGHRLYRHGGGWPGVQAQLIRIPDLRASLVILALADDAKRPADLAGALLDELVRTTPPRPHRSTDETKA
jgi:CubicO group peptidase (beta-lactamase class C family)